MAVLGNVNAHFPCPNHCGESYRQEDIKNHRKICLLEEISCEFSDVGCNQRFNREKQEEHVQENTQHHLSLAASQAIGTQQQLQQHQIQLKEVKESLEEDNQKQNSSLKEVEEKIMEDMRDLRNIVQQQQQTLFAFFGFITVLLLAYLSYFACLSYFPIDLKEEGTQNLGMLQDKYSDLSSTVEEIKMERRQEEGTQNLGKLQDKYSDLSSTVEEIKMERRQKSSTVEEIKMERRQAIQHLCALTNHVGQGHVKIDQTFEIKNFSSEKAKGGYWTGPAMYTHVCGYKVFFRIYPNGRDTEHDDDDVALVVVGPGQYDDFLSYPAEATFSFEFPNYGCDSNCFIFFDAVTWWNQPENSENVTFLTRSKRDYHFKVQNFLLNDTLTIRIHVDF